MLTQESIWWSSVQLSNYLKSQATKQPMKAMGFRSDIEKMEELKYDPNQLFVTASLFFTALT